MDAFWTTGTHYAKLDAIHYPPILPHDLRLADADSEAPAAATTPAGPEWSKSLDTRVSAHVDDSMLTILAHDHEAAGSEGLQMLVPPKPGGSWFDIPTVEGALVVQLGAMMQRWTADAWRATPHRVLCPPSGVVSDRLTLGFFFRPNHDALLALPDEADAAAGAEGQAELVEYEEVTAAEFIALPKGERLSTVVSPAGQCIYTPLSARRAS